MCRKEKKNAKAKPARSPRNNVHLCRIPDNSPSELRASKGKPPIARPAENGLTAPSFEFLLHTRCSTKETVFDLYLSAT